MSLHLATSELLLLSTHRKQPVKAFSEMKDYKKQQRQSAKKMGAVRLKYEFGPEIREFSSNTQILINQGHTSQERFYEPTIPVFSD